MSISPIVAKPKQDRQLLIGFMILQKFAFCRTLLRTEALVATKLFYFQQSLFQFRMFRSVEMSNFYNGKDFSLLGLIFERVHVSYGVDFCSHIGLIKACWHPTLHTSKRSFYPFNSYSKCSKTKQIRKTGSCKDNNNWWNRTRYSSENFQS